MTRTGDFGQSKYVWMRRNVEKQMRMHEEREMKSLQHHITQESQRRQLFAYEYLHFAVCVCIQEKVWKGAQLRSKGLLVLTQLCLCRSLKKLSCVDYYTRNGDYFVDTRLGVRTCLRNNTDQ